MVFRSLIFLAVLGVSPAFAQTYFEILEEQYNLAADPIAPEDIYEHAHPDSPLCIEVNEEDQNKDNVAYISKLTRTKDNLGPKLPKITITKIIYWTHGGSIPDYVFDEVQLESEPSEIRVTQKTPETFTLFVRRSAEFLFFKRVVSYKNERNRVTKRNYYGYCYPRHQSVSSIRERSDVSELPNSEPIL